jgi:hypothetical protein
MFSELTQPILAVICKDTTSGRGMQEIGVQSIMKETRKYRQDDRKENASKGKKVAPRKRSNLSHID